MLLDFEIMGPHFGANLSIILLKTGIFKRNKDQNNCSTCKYSNSLSINNNCGQRQPSHQPVILGETQGD
jgi:hypothetical protein